MTAYKCIIHVWFAARAVGRESEEVSPCLQIFAEQDESLDCVAVFAGPVGSSDSCLCCSAAGRPKGTKTRDQQVSSIVVPALL